jgi:hypothetical protein
MLEAVEMIFSSPSAFQASLQTSTVQALNRGIGDAMSLIEKTDGKSRLSKRRRNRVHILPADQAVTGISEENQALADAGRSAFSKDFTADHRKTSGGVAPICDGAEGTQTQASPSF